MNFTRDAVLALAPDAASSKAAQGLVSPANWPTLGANDAAVWGECKGSGAKPYQTQVDLSGPSFRCSCPSRKFPCKHGLALLLLRAEQGARFTGTEPPAWVSEWLGARQERERKKEEKREQQKVELSPEEVQAAAAREAAREAKKQEQRWERIEQGAADLQRWIGDLLQRGLGSLVPEKLDDWHTMAARLVDAQAPGLGQRLRQAAGFVGQGADWPERLLHRLGLLVLALRALEQRKLLSAASLADLRVVLGWPTDKADVLAQGEAVDDQWQVLGMAIDERDDRLIERRVWLQGLRSDRCALVLDHAHGGRGFDTAWVVGSVMQATLVFYPGSAPLRALVSVAPVVQAEAKPSLQQFAQQSWPRVARHYAACPWIPVQALLLADAVVVLQDGLRIVAEGRVLPALLPSNETWQLLAVGGGHPLLLMGEWDGEVFQPLTAWRSGEQAVVWQRSLQS